jgi:hypothetical protein
MPKYRYEYSFTTIHDGYGVIEAEDAAEANTRANYEMQLEGYDPMDGEIIDLNIELDDE